MDNYEIWVIKNIRAQYKMPDAIKEMPDMIEWLKRMGATKFIIKRFKEAHKNAKK